VILISLETEKSQVSELVFSMYFEFWLVDKAHKPTDSECYAPSSKDFSIYTVSSIFDSDCKV
jgi:hypothetical protein